MKCPHCEYEKTNEDKMCCKEDFYQITNNMRMEKMSKYSDHKYDIFGCPNCKKIFMD